MKSRVHCSSCPAPEAVVAWVMKGADDACMDDISRHIEACEICHPLAMETQATRDLMQTVGDIPGRDLAADIMTKLPSDAWSSSAPLRPSRRPLLLYWRIPLRIAAALVILLGIGRLLHTATHRATLDVPVDPAVLAIGEGRAWLLANQLPTGGWDSSILGGRPEYAEALCGLAVLAIQAGHTAIAPCEASSLQRAAGYLVARQTPDGQISRDVSAAMYNHGIATLALLEIHRLTHDAALDAPIDAALAFICNRQSTAGGWGYTPASPPNTSITAWQMKTLLQAHAQGRPIPLPVLQKALHWMAGTVGPQGYFGYEGPQQEQDRPATLTMMGAFCLFTATQAGVVTDPRLEHAIRASVRQLAEPATDDYHQSYFYASVAEWLDTGVLTATHRTVRENLLTRQIKAGQDAGAWQTEGDRWGATGGKLYSTSMAMLAITPQETQL